MGQQSFLDFEYGLRKRRTKRDEFLSAMDKLLPWQELTEIVADYYPKGQRGRPPKDLEMMVRMFFLHSWYRLSDKAIEEAVYDSGAMRTFLSVSLADEETPSARTFARFRRMLKKRGLDLKIEKIVRECLSKNGLSIRRGKQEEAYISKQKQPKK